MHGGGLAQNCYNCGHLRVAANLLRPVCLCRLLVPLVHCVGAPLLALSLTGWGDLWHW